MAHRRPATLAACGVLLAFGCMGSRAAEPPGSIQPDGGSRHGEILWDRFAIPHIYGATTRDVLRGYGYAQMENHAETILLTIATARGRLAEYRGAGSGDANITSDTQVRAFGIPARAQRWLRDGTEKQRRYIEAFVAGINEYGSRHGDTIDPGIAAILPVVPSDILAIVQYSIHFNFMPQQDCVPQLLARWQAGSPAGKTSVPAASECASKTGSNGWALAPSKSTSGNAILMGNPHLPWGSNQPVPNLGIYQWVEAQLVIGDPDHPRLNAYGVTFPGAPFIGIGFSDDVGWTHTNNTIKNADLFELQLTPDGGYLFDGRERALMRRTEQLLVRQPDGRLTRQTIEIAESIQGPIVATRSDGKALALRVAGLDGASIVSEYWGMIRARNLFEFIRANASLQMPFFNVLFADRDGEIMYLFGGRQPVRHGGAYDDYAGIIPGDTSRTLWTETLPWTSLPRAINPTSGFVANSNDPPWTSTYPRALDPSDYPAWIAPVEMTLRPQHSIRTLLARRTFSVDQVIEGKETTRMMLADRVLPDLIAAARASGNATAAAAADVLAAWDRTPDAASVGGPLFERWYELYVADPGTPPDPVFGPAYPKFRTEWTLANPLVTPDGLADAAGAVPFLVQAADELTKTFGTFALPWGATHRTVLVSHDPTYTTTSPVSNDPQSGTTNIFGPIRVIDSFQNPDPAQPVRLGYGGDSYVQVVEFTPEGPRARAVLTEGNASRPGSAHIADQLPIFDAKTLRPVLRLREEVEHAAVRRERF